MSTLVKPQGQEISEFGLGYDVVMRHIRPFLHQGYHLFVDNFYTSVSSFKDLFAQGVLATGTIQKRRGFLASSKKSGMGYGLIRKKRVLCVGRGPSLFGTPVVG